jgi:hypothetical protein
MEKFVSLEANTADEQVIKVRSNRFTNRLNNRVQPQQDAGSGEIAAAADGGWYRDGIENGGGWWR